MLDLYKVNVAALAIMRAIEMVNLIKELDE
jgi:hypothetical protein